MKYLNTEIRPMEDIDMTSVLEIENLCFIDPRKEEDIKNELHSNPYSNVMVIELGRPSDVLKSPTISASLMRLIMSDVAS